MEGRIVWYEDFRQVRSFLAGEMADFGSLQAMNVPTIDRQLIRPALRIRLSGRACAARTWKDSACSDPHVAIHRGQW
jgi:hypothetical protein